jgi:hypothetical protein
MQLMNFEHTTSHRLEERADPRTGEARMYLVFILRPGDRETALQTMFKALQSATDEAKHLINSAYIDPRGGMRDLTPELDTGESSFCAVQPRSSAHIADVDRYGIIDLVAE